MQGHRLLRAVAVLILIVAFVYLVLALGGALWLGGSGFGSGWGTGWTGWLVLPLAGAAVMAGLTLMVFGLMLFFLAKIDNNLTAARQQPRVKAKPAVVAPAALAPAVAAVAPAAPAPVDVAPAPERVEPEVAAPPVESPAVEPAAAEAPPASETPVLAEGAAWAAPLAVAAAEISVVEEQPAPTGTEAPATAVEVTDEGMPRMVYGEPVGEVALPGGVLPSVDVVEETLAAEPEVAAAPPDLVLREPVQIEVEASEPEIGAEAPEAVLPEVELPQVEVAAPEAELPQVEVSTPEATLPVMELPEVRAEAPEVELPEAELPQVEVSAPEAALPEVALPRIDLEAPESQLETAGMVTPETWTPEAAPAAEMRLPEIEISETAGPEPELAASAALSEATGVPEPELTSGVALEPVAAQVQEEAIIAPVAPPAVQEPAPAAAPPPGLDSLQSEVAALRAQLAALQAQLGQLVSAATPAPAAPVSVAPAPEVRDLAEELPDEPPPDAPAEDAQASASRLPGSDEVARIAAEMNALKPKPDRPAPAMPPAVATTTMRAPQGVSLAGGDNLEIIMGVGPIYAKRLREAGITTYAQLADASYEALEKVTRGNLERVMKEDWRGQARRLMERG